MLVTDEWAGWMRDPTFNHDKIWAGAVTDTGMYLAVWGRRGTKYQHQEKQFHGPTAAYDALHNKMLEKSRGGYRPVAFNDPRSGNIPSFATGMAAAGSEPLEITPESLIARLRSIRERLERGVRDLAGLVLEYQQTGQLADLLIAWTGTSSPERLALTNALAAAEQTLQRTLLRGGVPA